MRYATLSNHTQWISHNSFWPLKPLGMVHLDIFQQTSTISSARFSSTCRCRLNILWGTGNHSISFLLCFPWGFSQVVGGWEVVNPWLVLQIRHGCHGHPRDLDDLARRNDPRDMSPEVRWLWRHWADARSWAFWDFGCLGTSSDLSSMVFDWVT